MWRAPRPGAMSGTGIARREFGVISGAGLPASLRPDTPVRLAVGAIVKDEAPYLLEWIAFHRVTGFSRFFIADNASIDGTTEMLAALEAAGVVDRIDFADTYGVPPQLPAYREILRRHGSDADWIAFIDADEFLEPMPPHRSTAPAVATLDARPEIGAIAVNWAVYGSSGAERAASGLVIERFTGRAFRRWPVNRHFKSIVRPAAVASTGATPHDFVLHPPFEIVHADGAPLERNTLGEGMSGRVAWEALRLNHYVIKSREEYVTIKAPRGRATVSGWRAAAFFDDHDRNEVTDPAANRFAAATRAEQARLAALVSAALEPAAVGHDTRSAL